MVAVGRATRLLEYALGHDKSYCGDIVLGASTDTDDAEGSVISVADPGGVGLDQVVSGLSSLLGEIEQVPPRYSAIKLQGKKAYELARKGQRVELSPRRVRIKAIAVLGWEPPTISIVVICSKGTYIRSLARDLGERLGVGGHLGALIRLSSGPFKLEDAIRVEELKLAAEVGYLDELILPMDFAVTNLPAIIVEDEHARDMWGGRRWPIRAQQVPTGPVRVYSTEGIFLGIAEAADGKWQPRLVLAEDR